MATRAERRVSPDFDPDQRYEELLERHERLRADAEEVVRENKALRDQQTPPLRSTAGVFLILLACLIVGRLALYQFVEIDGNASAALSVLTNLLFAGGSVVLLVMWVRAEWEEVVWLAVPKFTIVFVLLLFCADVVSDGAILRGEWRAELTHPILAGVIAIAGLLMAASPLAVLLVRGALQLVNNGLGGKGGA